MPQNLNCHIFPKELGAGVNQNGNVEIFAIDKNPETGHNSLVTIEINSANWKHILGQFGRLKGVGIAKPASRLEVVTDEGNENNGS